MNRQEEILLEVAKKHGLGIGQARHIFECMCKTIKEVLEEPSKDENGNFNYSDFHCISLINFGKFIPSKRKVERGNLLTKNIKLKKEQDGNL